MNNLGNRSIDDLLKMYLRWTVLKRLCQLTDMARCSRLTCRKPCRRARPSFSQFIEPPPGRRRDSGRPTFRSSATFFHDVQPVPHADFVVHPELASEHMCPSALHGMPVRQCDIDAAMIQRASQRRYVKNPFVY